MSKVRIQQRKSTGTIVALVVTLFVIVAVGVCIMLVALPKNRLDNPINASSQTIPTDDNVVKLNDENINFDVKEGGTFVMQVCLVDFADLQAYDSPEAIAEVDRLFNEQVFNDFISVSEYYAAQSKGKLNVVANISYVKLDTNYNTVASQGFNYDFEKALFDNAVANGELKVYKGQFNAGIIILPGVAVMNKITWAHTYMSQRLSVCSLDQVYNTIVCHETGHMFGLMDLYTNTGFNPVSNYELMGATNVAVLSPINAYHRAGFGWLTESDYDDDISSEIETINKAGVYTLKPYTSDEGIIAYKFLAKNGESFYAEYRVANGSGIDNVLPRGEEGGLYIYRVNSNKHGNLNVTFHEDCEIFVVGPHDAKNGTKLFTTGQTLGGIGSKISLVYADSTKAFASISNIKITNEGLSFEINFTKADVVEYIGVAYSANTYSDAVGAKVYLNGQYVTQTTEKGEFFVAGKKGDVLKIVADYFEDYEITLTDKIIIQAKMIDTIGYVTIKSGYEGFKVSLYENDKLLFEGSSQKKEDTLVGPISLRGSVAYKLIYTRGDFVKSFDLNFTKNGQKITIEVDPYVDEDAVQRTYTGQLKLPSGVILNDVEVFVNNKKVTTTGSDGKFSFTGKKNDEVSFQKYGIEIASTTLGTTSALTVNVQYTAIKITVNSNHSDYTLKVYENDFFKKLVFAKAKKTEVCLKIKYDEVNKYKVVYTRENYEKTVEFELSATKTTYEMSISENGEQEKSIFDKIGEGVDYFTYNMGKGFERLGRALWPW